jgi:hypothetical protein
MKALLGVLTVTTSLAVSKGNERIVASDSIPAGDSIPISEGRVGPVQVCDSLRKVTVAFRGYRVSDTVFSSEGSRWPAKRVFLTDGIIYFSTSWADTSRVWNMSTTSPSVRSPRGFHVGMRLGEALRVDSATVDLPEGAVVVSFKREKIGALIDGRSQEQFYATYNFKGTPTIAMLSPDAVITELLTGGDCK